METCVTITEGNDSQNRKSISPQLRFKVFKRDAFICQYCGRTSDETQLEADHVIPRSKGGLTNIDNLITSCKDCNRGKSDMDVIENQKFREREIVEQQLRYTREKLNELDGKYNENIKELAALMQKISDLTVREFELDMIKFEKIDLNSISQDEVNDYFESIACYDDDIVYTKEDYINANISALKELKEELLTGSINVETLKEVLKVFQVTQYIS